MICKKSFGDLHVLRGINLNIQKGDVVAVLGSSGSGKQRFWCCMNFLEHADVGTMVFDGQQVELSRITHAQIPRPGAAAPVLCSKTTTCSPTTRPRCKTGRALSLPARWTSTRPTRSPRAALDKVGMGGPLRPLSQPASGGSSSAWPLPAPLLTTRRSSISTSAGPLDPELTGEVLTVMRRLADEVARCWSSPTRWDCPPCGQPRCLMGRRRHRGAGRRRKLSSHQAAPAPGSSCRITNKRSFLPDEP